MTRSTIRVWLTSLLLLGTGSFASAQIYPTAIVTISGSQTGTASGTMTIGFNGYSETVPYGQYSTASSIASAFAANFSADPIAELHPRLCGNGVCAKATGAIITFQLKTATSYGTFTLSCTGPCPFQAAVTSTQAKPTVILASSTNPSQYGSAAVFAASVIAPNSGNGSPSPTGIVTFFDGTTTLGPVAVNLSVIAMLSTSTLSVGSHSITAVYSGDTNYVQSTSSALVQVVTPTDPTSPTIISLDRSSGNVGLAVNISGWGFGAAEGQSTITFNGALAAVLNWNDSSITAIVPSSATTGPIVVTRANGEMSNNNFVFTVNTVSCTY